MHFPKKASRSNDAGCCYGTSFAKAEMTVTFCTRTKRRRIERCSPQALKAECFTSSSLLIYLWAGHTLGNNNEGPLVTVVWIAQILTVGIESIIEVSN